MSYWRWSSIFRCFDQWFNLIIHITTHTCSPHNILNILEFPIRYLYHSVSVCPWYFKKQDIYIKLQGIFSYSQTEMVYIPPLSVSVRSPILASIPSWKFCRLFLEAKIHFLKVYTDPNRYKNSQKQGKLIINDYKQQNSLVWNEQ